MSSTRIPIRHLALAAALCAFGSAHAVITVSTNQAAFIAATSGTSATDNFGNLTINTALGATSSARSAGSYGYTLSTQTDIYVVPVAGNIAVSTGSFSDTFTFDTFTQPIEAFGGNFYRTNILGEGTGGSVTLVATDINGLTLTTSLPAPTFSAGTPVIGTTFAGFLSDVPLASVVVSDVVANTDSYVTADNLILASVPEASTWMMMLAGGAAVMRLGARRRD